MNASASTYVYIHVYILTPSGSIAPITLILMALSFAATDSILDKLWISQPAA